jgi:hypothetical protein
MRIKTQKDSAGLVTAYRLWLTAHETYQWAHREGACWPGSTISGSRLMVKVSGAYGLCAYTLDSKPGKERQGYELQAIVADHLTGRAACCRHLWPTWE